MRPRSGETAAVARNGMWVEVECTRLMNGLRGHRARPWAAGWIASAAASACGDYHGRLIGQATPIDGKQRAVHVVRGG